MLEAEPAELASQANTQLAEHVRVCARCSAIAARLLEGQGELARALEEVRPPTGAEQALRAARERPRPAVWRRSVWRWAAPLAAAAALVAVVVARSLDPGVMPGEIVAGPAPRIEPLVEAEVGQNVMVFETRNRTAKVIWFY